MPVEQNTTSSTVPSSLASAQNQSSGDIPTTNDSPVPVTTVSTRYIKVKNNVLDFSIDPLGGDIVSLVLPQYPTELNGDEAFTMLNTKPGQYYVAQSGLVGTNGTDKNGQRPQYQVERFEYDATNGAVTIPLTVYHDNMAIVKTFTVEPDSYLIRVSHDIVNNSAETKQVRQFAQLNQVVQGQKPTYLCRPIVVQPILPTTN